MSSVALLGHGCGLHEGRIPSKKPVWRRGLATAAWVEGFWGGGGGGFSGRPRVIGVWGRLHEPFLRFGCLGRELPKARSMFHAKG